MYILCQELAYKHKNYGRELPSVLELFNLIINETEHFTLMCHELEAIRSYTPADKALVVL